MESRTFEELVVRYQGVVCGVAYAILRDRARSEEVAQEAFLLAWRRLADGPIGAGWICATARNLARNAARRHTEVPMNEEPIALERDARDELIAREDGARANAALAQLPEKYRDAVVVYYHGDESMAAVAEALGISRANAKQRVHRGRELLREALGDVESTLRAVRPAAAFTAACLALWAVRGTAAAASTSTASTSTAPATAIVATTTSGGIVTTALGWAFGLAIAGAVTFVVVDELAANPAAATAKRSHTVTTATGTSGVTSHAAPPSIVATASTANAPRPDELVSLHTPPAPIRAMVSLLANEMNIPIRVEDGFDANVECDATDIPALALLDQLLAQANAKRVEMPALRIVQSGGSTDAASLGGDLISLHLDDVPVRDALREIEPKLRVAIERDVKPMQLPGPTNVDGDLYIMTRKDDPAPEVVPYVTIDVTNVSAGEALELVLEQTGLSYEPTTGYRIVPR